MVAHAMKYCHALHFHRDICYLIINNTETVECRLKDAFSQVVFAWMILYCGQIPSSSFCYCGDLFTKVLDGLEFRSVGKILVQAEKQYNESQVYNGNRFIHAKSYLSHLTFNDTDNKGNRLLSRFLEILIWKTSL